MQIYRVLPIFEGEALFDYSLYFFTMDDVDDFLDYAESILVNYDFNVSEITVHTFSDVSLMYKGQSPTKKGTIVN